MTNQLTKSVRSNKNITNKIKIMMKQTKSYQSSFISVTILFFLWGFITVLVDSLIPRLKDVFEMSYAKTVLVQFAFFTAFFVVSLPAGALLT